jgi:hypothetical protein
MTGYGQSEKIKGLNYQTVFTNAVWNYLNYISESEKRSVDTLFIELNDTLNFNLPKKIQTTVIDYCQDLKVNPIHIFYDFKVGQEIKIRWRLLPLKDYSIIQTI